MSFFNFSNPFESQETKILKELDKLIILEDKLLKLKDNMDVDLFKAQHGIVKDNFQKLAILYDDLNIDIENREEYFNLIGTKTRFFSKDLSHNSISIADKGYTCSIPRRMRKELGKHKELEILVNGGIFKYGIEYKLRKKLKNNYYILYKMAFEDIGIKDSDYFAKKILRAYPNPIFNNIYRKIYSLYCIKHLSKVYIPIKKQKQLMIKHNDNLFFDTLFKEIIIAMNINNIDFIL